MAEVFLWKGVGVKAEKIARDLEMKKKARNQSIDSHQ